MPPVKVKYFTLYTRDRNPEDSGEHPLNQNLRKEKIPETTPRIKLNQAGRRLSAAGSCRACCPERT